MRHDIDIEETLEVICDVFHVKRAAIAGKARTQPLGDVRKMIFLIMYNLSGWTYEQIAVAVGRDEGTVRGYRPCVRAMLRQDKMFRWRAEQCLGRLDFDDEFIRQFIKATINDKN